MSVKEEKFSDTNKKTENLLLYHMPETTVKPLERHVQDGHDEEEGNGSHQHTTGTANTQGNVTVGTHTVGKDQR